MIVSWEKPYNAALTYHLSAGLQSGPGQGRRGWSASSGRFFPEKRSRLAQPGEEKKEGSKYLGRREGDARTKAAQGSALPSPALATRAGGRLLDRQQDFITDAGPGEVTMDGRMHFCLILYPGSSNEIED
jgi:hypothetical protein